MLCLSAATADVDIMLLNEYDDDKAVGEAGR